MKRAFSWLAVVLVGFACLCLAAGHVEAQAGVGIMPGIIRVDKPLLPGGRYNLTSLQVINTGSEPSQYEVELASVAEQKELQPPAEFIILSPTSFYLEPGASQVISLSLDIPVKAKPGDYLAYIEAHPVATSQGGMTIGVAAANKLYFTVRPANAFVGAANHIANFFTGNAPVSYIVLGAVVAGLLAFFLRRRLKVDIRVTRR
jgi:P pilus assembly chaperone PapD